MDVDVAAVVGVDVEFADVGVVCTVVENTDVDGNSDVDNGTDV